MSNFVNDGILAAHVNVDAAPGVEGVAVNQKIKPSQSHSSGGGKSVRNPAL